ncbi:probable RNA-binding protein 46 [Dendroctonus ponderosae]|uniref:probable RNA-binding protein 46 n=1 Tax=Dendroctonus ponderosae TaxID=77166 RepID=UPI0020356F4D|nr:probable RNA-binding protein 46 [Dendroctonus ponderosae]
MIRVLYVKNLPIHYSNERVNCTFQYLCKGLITKTHKIKNYAFVHCVDREAAQLVMERLLGLVLDDCRLEVEWARPRQYSNQSRARHPPINFCLNVPLRSRRIVKQLLQSRRSSPPNSDSDSGQTSPQSDEM